MVDYRIWWIKEWQINKSGLVNKKHQQIQTTWKLIKPLWRNIVVSSNFAIIVILYQCLTLYRSCAGFVSSAFLRKGARNLNKSMSSVAYIPQAYNKAQPRQLLTTTDLMANPETIPWRTNLEEVNKRTVFNYICIKHPSVWSITYVADCGLYSYIIINTDSTVWHIMLKKTK